MPQIEERWQPAVREKRYRQRKDKKNYVRLVSEGDSWFDYPPHPNIIDYIDDTERFAIKRFETSGDTLHNMVNKIDAVLSAILSEKPLCLLFSGGGNDVVAKGFIDTLFRPYDPALSPREHLKPEIWTDKLSKIENDFVSLMHEVGSKVPVLVHGYDHMPPSNKGARYDGFRVSGPWVQPAMIACGITDTEFQRAIARELIDDFNEILVRLAKQYPLHFIHIDLRGLFTVNDWLNEIHLKRSAYKVAAKKFVDAIDTRLPPVLSQRKALGIDP
jgi:hypothetical protein